MRYIKKKAKNDSEKQLTHGIQSMFLRSEPDEQSAETDLLYLKHAIIKDQNPEIIAQKLISTRKLREDMCAKLETDYREQFPFFFTNPELVSSSYKIQLIRILVNNSSITKFITDYYFIHSYCLISVARIQMSILCPF